MVWLIDPPSPASLVTRCAAANLAERDVCDSAGADLDVAGVRGGDHPSNRAGRVEPRCLIEVYDWCMARSRTNIELDDDHVARIMERYGVATKTAAVDLALRHLAGQPMSRDEACGMRGANAIGEVPSDVPVDFGS